MIRCDDGTVILAGQSHDSASAYAADLRAVLAGTDIDHDERPPVANWVERLQQFDPRRIVFAHDLSVVEPLP